MNCPYCQKSLNVTGTLGEQPSICPHCLSNIENPRLAPVSQAPNVLRDIRHPVRRYGGIFWLILCLLASLCLGLIAYATYEKVTNRKDIRDIFYGPSFCGLDLLSVLAIGRFLWICFLRKPENATPDRVLSVLVLTALLSLAVAVFFVVVCNVL